MCVGVCAAPPTQPAGEPATTVRERVSESHTQFKLRFEVRSLAKATSTTTSPVAATHAVGVNGLVQAPVGAQRKRLTTHGPLWRKLSI